MKTIQILIAFLLLSFTSTSFSEDTINNLQQPKDIAQSVYTQFQKGLTQEQTSQMVDNYFDTKSMGQHALGLSWRSLQDGDKEAYLDAFDKFFKKNLYNVLQNYPHAQIKDLNQRVSGSSANISATIIPQSGTPIAINLPLEASNNTWKTYDVVIENISLIQGYKAQFNEVYKKNGIQGLIVSLKSKS